MASLYMVIAMVIFGTIGVFVVELDVASAMISMFRALGGAGERKEQ